MVQASGKDISQATPFGCVPEMANWEQISGQIQDPLKGLYLPAGLVFPGVPQDELQETDGSMDIWDICCHCDSNPDKLRTEGWMDEEMNECWMDGYSTSLAHWITHRCFVAALLSLFSAA